MPKHLTYEEVKLAFEKRGYTLLSEFYKNNKTKLDYICHCGNRHSISFDAFKRGQGCNKCGDKIKRNTHLKKMDIEEIKQEFINRGYILLEDRYIDTTTKMKYKCPKHPNEELKISYEKFKVGRGCYYCGREKITSVHRVSFEVVKKEFEDRGYKLLATEYHNAGQKLPYICPEHKDKKQTISFRNFRQGQGCRYCGSEEAAKKTKGDKNSNWQGGITVLNRYLRKHMKEWKQIALESHEFKCFVTKENNRDLQVHHVKSFRKIRDEVIKELNMPIHRTIGEYSEQELNLMVEKLKEKHDEIIGIPLKKNIHQIFHKEYGFYTTLNDLYEFRERYLNGEFGKVEKQVEQLKFIL